MQYKGIVVEDYFYPTPENENRGKLYAYGEDERPLIIVYDKVNPFFILEIGIFLFRSKINQMNHYSLWKIESLQQSDEECIALAIMIASQVRVFTRDVLQCLKCNGMIQFKGDINS